LIVVLAARAYLPDAQKTPEPRSVVADASDAVLFTGGVVHLFAAPVDDLTLLCKPSSNPILKKFPPV
jgi:hypothetical protein